MESAPNKEVRVEFDPAETRWSVSDILPETIVAEIIETEGDATFAEGGATFESMVERLGGVDGVVVDQVGQRHAVSMRKWLNIDHSRLRFAVRVKYQIREEKRRLINDESSK
jgi:hypothetical protein